MLLYEWEEGSGVLCPNFNISKIDKNTYGCLANFSMNSCNRTVTLTLEAWTNSAKLLQSFGQVYINCKNIAKNILPNLAEAVFSILKSVAPILTENDTNLAENGTILAKNCTDISMWSPWSKCSKSCGDASGIQKRNRQD